MSINENLLNIYRKNWKELRDNLKRLGSDKYTNPFLLAFDDKKFNDTDIRVMIFGQETKGWGDQNRMFETVDEISSMYNSFFCLEKFYRGYGKSSFWKAFRFFKKEIKLANPDKNIYFSWNNINKVGKPNRKTGVNSEVRLIERKCFSVVASEVELFKPHIVIFLTGPRRDSDIKHHFKDAEFISADPNIKTRAFAKVESQFLPTNTVRIYHPSYYRGYYKVRNQAASKVVQVAS